MQYLLDTGRGKIKFYYSSRVYSPVYSSQDTIALASAIIEKKGLTSVMDISCGCGISGLTVKYLHPEVNLILCDVDFEAIRVARLNSKRLGLSADFRIADLDNTPVDLVIANLPTYDELDMEQQLNGPPSAYFGDGLKLYKKLFRSFRGRFLVAECQKKLHKEFHKIATENGLKVISQENDAFLLSR